MFAQVQLFPDQASTMAPRVDALYFVLLAFSGFFSILIAALIIYFAIRYRRKSTKELPPPIHGSISLEVVWSVVPLLIALGIYAWGAQVFFDMHQPPDDSLEVYVVAKQWMWHIQHSGGQREINELHVPLGKPIKLTLISQDVIHNFALPAFRVKQDVFPGRYSTLWFTPTKKGEFPLYCAEYCGTNHSRMVGKIVVMEPARYETWLTTEADDSLASEGRKLFLKLQCITCHNREAQNRAPLLEDIYNQRVPLKSGGSVVADYGYLRESILNPDAKIVAGYEPIMPSYKGQVNEVELLQVITFIRSLKAGDTPPRVESTEPPEKASSD
jgi:cytochrome c oxidase subunit 2